MLYQKTIVILIKKEITMRIVLILLIFMLSSCSANSKLEYALEFAGENRVELEKVLAYYKHDELKYEAACFLIENMPYYYSHKGAELDSVRIAKASGKKGFIHAALKEKWGKFTYRNMDKVFDSHVITAKYLIENIENAFEAWNKRSWNKYYSFQDFCELVLPYRIGNEPLEVWRPVYRAYFENLLDSLYKGTDIVEAAHCLSIHLKQTNFVYNLDFDLPRLGPLFLFNNHVGGCRETVDYTVYVFRSLGFPVTVDFYHFSPENQHDHLWNALKDTTGLYVPFNMGVEVLRNGGDGRRKGKVYRIGYSTQNFRYSSDWYKDIPQHLRNPCLKDVTADYFGANEIRIEVDVVADYFMYLGIFTPRGWLPIDIAKNEGGYLVANNIEPDVIFQPLIKDKEEIKPCGFPFVLKDGEVNYFIPDSSAGNEIELYRKYPLREYIRWYMSRIVGGKIEASNDLNFKDRALLCQISETPRINYNEVYPALNKKFRYVRYVAPEEKPVELAELKLFNTLSEEIKTTVVNGSSPYKGNESVSMLKINDGNYLTYCLSDVLGGFVTLELEQPEEIAKIVYIPRNDENFISIGDTYELFYQAGAKGWLSLGRKTATVPKLIYDNIPGNSLLWLRNLSRGQEEQVFWMVDGEQMFLEYKKLMN